MPTPGERPPQRAVDLAATVREAVAEAAPLANGHTLSVDAPGAAVIDGSPDDLHRLALNLVENALIHTPAGTPVVASVRSEGDWVRLEVSDRGPGIPADARDHVFDRFARDQSGAADASPTAGTGLGLAIVRAVAEAHGGTAEAGEAPGGGALFAVTLPGAGALRSGRDRVSDPESGPVSQPKGAQIS